MGSAAKRAGLDAKSFQELAYVAKVNRIEVDALTDGMKELSLRADEFLKTGAGGGAESFQRLGYSAVELAEKLKRPSDLFVEIIGRMERLDKAAQIRVADELFGGTGGERFVELLDRGADGVRTLIAEANEFGAVMSEEMIAKADEADRRFTALATTVSTNLKTAIVDVVDVWSEFFDGFKVMERQASSKVAAALQANMRERADLRATIDDFQERGVGEHMPMMINARRRLAELVAESERLQGILNTRLLETPAKKAGDDARTAKPPVDQLGSALSSIAGSASTGAAGINSFADAIKALKAEIPGLAEKLATLDAENRIESIYRAGLANAKSGRDAMGVAAMRNQALASLRSKSAREAADRGMLDLIGYAEGTDKGRGYNETLSYGAYSGGDRNLVQMTLNEVLAMQKQMLAHPDNNFNSSAVGRYQIVSKTLKGLMGTMGLSGNELFDPAMQDRMAQQLLRQRGNNVGGLRSEWEGLKRIDPSLIRKAYDGSSVSMPGVDEGVQAQRDTAEDQRAERMQANAAAASRHSQMLRDQARAYSEVVVRARQYSAEQGIERQALTMTQQAAAAFRYENQMLTDLQREGVAVTAEQREQIRALAEQMASAEVSTAQLADSQEAAREAADAWRGLASDTLKGFVGDLRQGKSAGEAFANVLSRIADKLIDMAINQLFQNAFGGSGGGIGSGGGTGGNWLATAGNVLMSLFGFRDGGEIPAFASGGRVSGPGGPRDDKVLARLSAGEYVVNAKATAKHRDLLAAINADRLPAFADGGLAGARPISTPRIAPAGGANAGQTFNVSTNVTVNASGGTPAQNDELARKTSKAVEQQVRAVVQSELQTQMRQGGVLSRR